MDSLDYFVIHIVSPIAFGAIIVGAISILLINNTLVEIANRLHDIEEQLKKGGK